MKWRLDEPHYDNDSMMTLDTGTEVGDGCANNWRYPDASANKALAGKPRPPSRSMTPLDDEAKKVWHQEFGGEAPERDPTRAVPITPADGKRDTMGHMKPDQPRPAPPGQPNPAPAVPNEPAKFGSDVTKDDSVAKEDSALNKTPEQHKPEESKPAGFPPKPTKG